MFAVKYFGSRYFPRRYFPRGANPGAPLTGGTGGQNRFRSATVPTLENWDDLQRFLQRTFDEIARSLNPVRSVADGGTGITSLNRGELLVGGEAPNAFTRVAGNATAVRRVLVSLGTGAEAGVPFWDVLQSGDLPVAGNEVFVGADPVLVGSAIVVIP